MHVLAFKRSSFSLDRCIILESGNATMSLVLKPRPSFKNQIDKTCCRLGLLVLLGHGRISKAWVAPGREGATEAFTIHGRN